MKNFVSMMNESGGSYPRVKIGSSMSYLKKDFLDMLEQDDANYELDSVTGELPVLNFEPSDIECILVTEEREINRIVKEIEQNTNKYSNDDIKLLSSKVSSAKQIDEDF